jgi:hypothetical protein
VGTGTADRTGGHQKITGMVVTVELSPDGYYEGYRVSLNGVPLWFRPYDGSDWTEAAHEAIEALCEVLRAHTGRTLNPEAE